MITTAAICGAGVGSGALLVARAFVPARPSLRIALQSGRSTSLTTLTPPKGDLIDKVGAQLVPVFNSMGLNSRTNADLAIIGRSPERQLAEKLTLSLFGFVFVPLVAAIMAVGGVAVPWAMPLWVAVSVAVLFFFIPEFGVKAEAESKRDEFRHALGAFLDLVVIGLSGGGGVESALDGAANTGDGWAFNQIRTALSDAQLRGESPWQALSALGTTVGVTELIELAASVGLAGTEGAKVRASLAAKAESLRHHQLAESEAKAQSASEQMSIPVVLLFGGFLVFIGYPAVSQVINGL